MSLPSQSADLGLPPLLPLDDALTMLERDREEGREMVSLTRPMARALYYAVWDATRGTPREHTPEDLHRLQLILSELGRVGWE